MKQSVKERFMDRREFVSKTVKGGLAAASALALGGMGKALAAPQASSGPFDLVAVKGGEPEVMFDRAMASLGGMEKFVPKGGKVLVKPNMGWDVSPERAGNTHPKLVARIVRHCLDAGAKQVAVFDHTCDQWTRCYTNSGIERAVKDAGGQGRLRRQRGGTIIRWRCRRASGSPRPRPTSCSSRPTRSSTSRC